MIGSLARFASISKFEFLEISLAVHLSVCIQYVVSCAVPRFFGIQSGVFVGLLFAVKCYLVHVLCLAASDRSC